MKQKPYGTIVTSMFVSLPKCYKSELKANTCLFIFIGE